MVLSVPPLEGVEVLRRDDWKRIREPEGGRGEISLVVEEMERV